MNKLLLVIGFLFCIVTIANAQEICDDGIDNDGDGFIDCFDGECSENTACDGFYLGNDASCEAEPSQFPQFSLSLGYKSPLQTANNLSRIAIGDLDRDGFPEIATQNTSTNKVYLLNGLDGSIKRQADVKSPEWRMSMANVQDDDCGEVFAVSIDNGYRIVALDCDLNKLWTSERLPTDPAFIGHADFDGDGQPEMYYKDEIRDPITGIRLVKNAGVNWNDLPGGPVAVDILGDEDLELVLGNKIYRVNLGNRTADNGSLTLLATMPEFYRVKTGSYGSGTHATTSVADYNLDGKLDILLTGASNNNVTTIFFWDVQNSSVRTFKDPGPVGSFYEFGWRRGAGRINIGDLDGDGQLNAVFVSGKYLYCLDENLNPIWRNALNETEAKDVNEETSGITGCTLFDFNGDGRMEVVYRDEDYLYIIDGKEGETSTSIPCRSRTSVEYPIVADVDADGSTEICVVCTDESYLPNRTGSQLGLYDPSEVRIYKSGGEPWVPARRLWNQHGYFNVNINDDLSIPIRQQKHQLVWSTGSCGVSGDTRPLNGFLNQSPFLSSDGCPTYAAPDLGIVENSFTITPPSCPDADFTVSFEFENIGDVPLSGNVPITFYDGDPLVAGTNKLGTEFITLTNFEINETVAAIDIPVTGSGGPFTLYAVMNDNGTSTPTPITLPNSNFLECDYVNNIVFAEVDPLPFVLTTEKTNNVTCDAGSVPPNGSARVYGIINGNDESADNDFYWYNGATVSGAADYTGSIYTDLPAGTYSVFAIHKLAGCTSDTVQVVIEDSARTVAADITIDRGNTNCEKPNGRLAVAVNGGEPVGDFTYEWYIGNSVGGGLVISTSHIADSLEARTYTVLVTDKATGCQTIESKEVPDEAITPVITANAVNIICSDVNSGSVTATVGGATAGYTFEWFRGPSRKPTPDFTTSSVNNLPKGDYTVIATDNVSNCESDPVTVTVSQTLVPSINNVSSTDNTSCDSSLPNGSVTVVIDGNPADHTIEWYSGATTTTGVISNNTTVNNLAAGEYTIKLIGNATGCFVTDKVTVLNNIVKPKVSLVMEPVTQCSPFNGRITATVDLDSESDYTFSWYEGKLVKPTADFSETSHILENLEGGFYTVRAFNTLTNCFADAKTIEVTDEATVAIIQTAAGITPASECNEANGELQIEVNSPNNTSGFLIQWYNGSTVTGTPFLTENGVTNSVASGLFTGLYTVQATDLDNGCSNEQIFNLPYADAHKLVATDTLNATTCIPNNGSITVNLTPTPLAGFDESNYEIRLYNNNDTSVPPLRSIPGATGTPGVGGTTNYIFTDLPEGSYIIQALADADLGNCSVYAQAQVDLEATDPSINEVSNIPNINCSIATATGSIVIEIDGGADPSDYTINWYEGSDTSAPLLGTNTAGNAGVNGDSTYMLVGGNYTVEVINNLTACATTATYGVNESPTIVTINSSDLLINSVTRCDTVNSTVNILNIYENGVIANKNDFTFEWYDDAMTLLPDPNDASTPNTADSIYALAPGTYFVRVINSLTACSSSLTEFNIDNEITAPTITLDFQNPERCADPVSGVLRVTASGSSANYSYSWYTGASASGTVIGTGPEIVGLSANSYTVSILDSASFCYYEETYELVTNVNDVNISASATPVTNCASPDGTVFATITSDGTYNYTWTDAGGNIVGNTNRVNGLPEGDYTVVAVDVTDGGCQNTATVTITNDQQFPDLEVSQIAPLTVCDLARANGAARALVDGGYVGYTFEWFEGSTANGNIVFRGPEFSQMKDITYTVRATNNISQCASEQTLTISSEIPAVPSPTIEIIGQDTHCSLDNGLLEASVNAEGLFVFNWYNGEEVKGTPDFVGERYADLPAGFYTVTVVDTKTGCTSDPVTAEVLEELLYPEFLFDIKGVNCNESNGSALLRFTNAAEVNSIEWYDANGRRVEVGPVLTGATSGVYTVKIETNRGCNVEEDITIPTEINAFNGISRNGDARNSYFKIDCITDFPNNIVKIYNRAGTLVYETSGYDNNTKVFDGVSNRGINIMGQNVPDGTYFYVIDKNNGSKPQTGYLEIVN